MRSRSSALHSTSLHKNRSFWSLFQVGNTQFLKLEAPGRQMRIVCKKIEEHCQETVLEPCEEKGERRDPYKEKKLENRKEGCSVLHKARGKISEQYLVFE